VMDKTNTKILSLAWTRLLGIEFFHEDGQTDRYDETNRRFSRFRVGI
jgi:hypothetical protein